VNGSQLFASGRSSPRTVSGIASGGSGRSVSRFSIRSTGQSDRVASAARAVRSIPNPCTSWSRCARLNIGRLYRIGPDHDEHATVRVMFVLYLTIIVAGIGFFVVIGLTHH
jgi:hypothetical protein